MVSTLRGERGADKWVRVLRRLGSLMPGRIQRAGVQSLGPERRSSGTWEHSQKEERISGLERAYLGRRACGRL